MNYITIIVKVHKLLEDEHYTNQLYFYILNSRINEKIKYKLIDIFINKNTNEIHYLFWYEGDKNETTLLLKKEVLSFIGKYENIKYLYINK